MLKMELWRFAFKVFFCERDDGLLESGFVDKGRPDGDLFCWKCSCVFSRQKIFSPEIHFGSQKIIKDLISISNSISPITCRFRCANSIYWWTIMMVLEIPWVVNSSLVCLKHFFYSLNSMLVCRALSIVSPAWLLQISIVTDLLFISAEKRQPATRRIQRSDRRRQH